MRRAVRSEDRSLTLWITERGRDGALDGETESAMAMAMAIRSRACLHLCIKKCGLWICLYGISTKRSTFISASNFFPLLSVMLKSFD